MSKQYICLNGLVPANHKGKILPARILEPFAFGNHDTNAAKISFKRKLTKLPFVFNIHDNRLIM